jgi:sugar phosphate permease
MGYDSDTAIDIFSWYETGGLVGNILLGLMSDLLPIRSPVYLFATIASAILVVVLGQQHPKDSGGS